MSTKTGQSPSDKALSSTLAFAQYMNIEDKSMEEKISEHLKAMRILCEEYNVDYDQVS